jgi:hypothetical protein
MFSYGAGELAKLTVEALKKDTPMRLNNCSLRVRKMLNVPFIIL